MRPNKSSSSKDLQACLHVRSKGELQEQVGPETEFGKEPHKDDIILMGKGHMSDGDCCQAVVCSKNNTSTSNDNSHSKKTDSKIV